MIPTPPRPRVKLAHPGWKFPYAVICDACPTIPAGDMDPDGPPLIEHTQTRTSTLKVGMREALNHLVDHHAIDGVLHA